MLSEKDGVTLLTRAFKAAGYRIENNVVFDEDGVVFDVDGWDAAARVGFEYRTSEADDKHDLTDDELSRLGARIERGELTLLIVDDVRVPDEATMLEFAQQFLKLIAERAPPASQSKSKSNVKSKPQPAPRNRRRRRARAGVRNQKAVRP